MTPDRAVAFLMEFYGPKQAPTPAACGYLREVLDAMGPPETRAVLARRLIESSSRFPTVERVRAMWAAVKPPPPRRLLLVPLAFPKSAPPEAPCDPAHARIAFALVRRIMAGGVRGAARVEAFRTMAQQWPGVGWEEAVQATEADLGM